MSRCALLICTYNEPTRTPMYEDVIRWWIQHSTFDIYVVDSYGKPFHDHIEQHCHTHHFDQTVYYHAGSSTSILELYSLQESIRAFAGKWSEYDYIIKMTGKYTLPDLEAFTKTISDPFDMIVQNKLGTVGHRHCEIVMYRTQRMSEWVHQLLETVTNTPCILERALSILLEHISYGIFPDLPNRSSYKRGAGDFMNCL